MKLLVRASPNSKAKGKSKPSAAAQKKKSGGDPQSTMVSSPVQAAQDRRLDRYQYTGVPAARLSVDEDSDGFEPIRTTGKPRRANTHEMGPPITSDQKLDQLDHMHRVVVEDFQEHAKIMLQDVSNRRSYRHTIKKLTVVYSLSLRRAFGANRSLIRYYVIWASPSPQVNTLLSSIWNTKLTTR